MARVCRTRTAAPNDRALATKPAPAPAGTVTSTVLEGTSTPQLAPTGAPAVSRAALTRSSRARLRVTSLGGRAGGPDLGGRAGVEDVDGQAPRGVEVGAGALGAEGRGEPVGGGRRVGGGGAGRGDQQPAHGQQQTEHEQPEAAGGTGWKQWRHCRTSWGAVGTGGHGPGDTCRPGR